MALIDDFENLADQYMPTSDNHKTEESFEEERLLGLMMPTQDSDDHHDGYIMPPYDSEYCLEGYYYGIRVQTLLLKSGSVFLEKQAFGSYRWVTARSSSSLAEISVYLKDVNQKMLKLTIIQGQLTHADSNELNQMVLITGDSIVLYRGDIIKTGHYRCELT